MQGDASTKINKKLAFMNKGAIYELQSTKRRGSKPLALFVTHCSKTSVTGEGVKKCYIIYGRLLGNQDGEGNLIKSGKNTILTGCSDRFFLGKSMKFGTSLKSHTLFYDLIK